MSAKQIPPRTEPLAKGHIQADGLMTGDTMVRLAQGTQALAYYANTNRRTWAYPSDLQIGSAVPLSPPRVDMAAVATWYSFISSTSTTAAAAPEHTYQLPWRMTVGQRGIGAMVSVCSLQPLAIAMRLNLVQLAAHTMTTVNGAAVSGQLNAFTPAAINWRHLSQTSAFMWRQCILALSVDNPTLHANRRFVVEPQIQITSSFLSAVTLSQTIRAHISSITLFEFPDTDLT